eukprot:552649-Pleurochrysis_carterae.AAC.2
MPLPGEVHPRPCKCCAYGHDASTRAGELQAFEEQIGALEQAVDTDEGKTHWAAFIRKHNLKHANVGPGVDFPPVLITTLNDWVLSLLHVDLNEGKLT